MIGNTHQTEVEKEWLEKFPSTLSRLFAFYQCLCTIAIIGCEVGSILIDLYNATIYVGFWASLFFMVGWISQAVATSCRPTHQCATYTLILQCISSFFAACVIGFDAYFLVHPTTCFFPSTLCRSAVPVRGLFYSNDNFNNIKIPLIKGQLATAAIMFAFCIDYIIMYVVTHFRMKHTKTQSVLRTATSPTDIGGLMKNENTKNASAPTTGRNRSTVTDTPYQSASARSIQHSRWSIISIDINPIKI